MTRTQIAARLNVTPSTVTRLASVMLDEELIEEIPDPDRIGRQGFPSKLLRLKPRSLISAGVFIDPDRILTCIADAAGHFLSERHGSITERGFEAVLGQAGQALRDQVQALNMEPDDLLGCGVSYPGQHTHEPGRVFKTSQLAHWPTIDVRRDLKPFFDMPVFQINDAKAACLAELQFGACQSVPNFCYIWLSYGIGGAAVVDRSLYLGFNDTAAEFGGLFPKSRPRPSGQDLLDTLAEVGIYVARLEDIPARVLALPVVAEWRERAIEQLRWLCLAIARTFAPEAIVIGGSLAETTLDEIHHGLQSGASLGEDFEISAPAILRATTDTRPHLGAAALPLYRLTHPQAFFVRS